MPQYDDRSSHPSADAADRLSCQAFRARHGEYLDRLLSPSEEDRWRDHATACLPCARFDRSIRRSCELARAVPALEPSDEFYPRLRHRLYHVQDEERLARRGSGGHVSISVAIAGVMAAVAWSPLLQTSAAPLELPAVQAKAPPPAPGDSTAAAGANLFATKASLPGVWLGGRSVPPSLLGRRPTFRAALLAMPEDYSAFRLHAGGYAAGPVLTSSRSSGGSTVRD